MRPKSIAMRFIVAAFSLSALISAGQAAAQSSAVLVIGQQPETLDPYNTNVTLVTAVTKSFYEGLFQFDKDLQVKPVLATSYEVSEDGLTYIFKLRENVKFHDGTDFNAAAVKFNIERVLDRSNALARYNQFSNIDRVEVLDNYTVRFTLKKPFGPFINSLAHASAAMISPKALQEHGRNIAFNPVGTGPYRFVEWRQTDHIKGVRFEGYWRQGYPKVDNITWKPVPENSTRAAMLRTGEADFAFPLPYEQAAALKNSPHLNVLTTPSIITRYLSINVSQKPFDDIRVRQAINYAINREALVKVAFNGYAFPAQGFVPQGVAFAYKMEPWPYDPVKAKALLAEAGYPNGFETILWGGYNDSTTIKVVQFLQQQLLMVGIKVSMQVLEPGQRTEMVDLAPDPKTAPVRLYYIGWSSSTGEADWALRPLLATESMPPNLENNSYYSSAEFDGYIHDALAMTSEEDKREAYRKAQELLYVDLPWAPLVTEEILYARSKTLNGVYVMPDGNINIDEIVISR